MGVYVGTCVCMSYDMLSQIVHGRGIAISFVARNRIAGILSFVIIIFLIAYKFCEILNPAF